MLYFEISMQICCCLTTNNNRQWNLKNLRMLRIEAGVIN